MVLLLWGQWVLLVVMGPRRINPQLTITCVLPGGDKKTMVTFGWWLETPENEC